VDKGKVTGWRRRLIVPDKYPKPMPATGEIEKRQGIAVNSGLTAIGENDQ